MKTKLAVAAWAAVIGFLVIDPAIATEVGAKGMALWQRLTKRT